MTIAMKIGLGLIGAWFAVVGAGAAVGSLTVAELAGRTLGAMMDPLLLVLAALAGAFGKNWRWALAGGAAAVVASEVAQMLEGQSFTPTGVLERAWPALIVAMLINAAIARPRRAMG